MITSRTLLVAVLAAVAAPAAAAPLKIVTTTEGLAAVAREVGGDRTQVESLSRGVQDPHFVDANPTLAAKLGALDAAGAASYASRAQEFQRRLDADLARWTAELAPFRGKKIFTRHRTMTYFFDWNGLGTAGELEPRPGVPPPPAHLADLVQIAKRDGVKAISVENFYDTKSAEVVSKFSGAKIVLIPGDVGGEPGLDTYEKYMNVIVTRIGGALR